MSKKCKNPDCGKNVPKERESKSGCCNNQCSYEIKKIKQKLLYATSRKIIIKERKHNETLAYLYRLQETGVKLNGIHLTRLNFDLGFSHGITLIDDKIVAKVIGSYAYFIDSNDKLQIWKLNSRP
jgi:hypothetical protein